MPSKAMASANTGVPNDWAGVTLNEAIRVNHAAPKSWTGSCNACTNGQYTLNDKNEPLVTNVDLRGMSFRLCERCRAQLKAML